MLIEDIPLKHKSRNSWPLKQSQSMEEEWAFAYQAAFNLIIKKFTFAPVLAFSNWQLPYLLPTDASMAGLGAVLYQVQDGQTCVVAYVSRGLS